MKILPIGVALVALSAQWVFGQSEVALSSVFQGGEGVQGVISAIAVQPDGKVVIGGKFNSVNGIPRNNIARLNLDGTLDRTFVDSTGNGVIGQVFALVAQPQGGVIVGGEFSSAGNAERMNLARYNADGTIDKDFGGTNNAAQGVNGAVYALTLQPDGKIIVAGNFSSIFGQVRRSLARLNADSTLDSLPVSPDAVSGPVKALGVEPNGTIIAGGGFTVQNKSARSIVAVVPAQTGY